ncbi:MAG: hypothetical protein GY941_23095 [Planctomycetes bacterium]|nr:hypothetical protein [Planctomycetota bacterium]
MIKRGNWKVEYQAELTNYFAYLIIAPGAMPNGKADGAILISNYFAMGIT